MRVALLCVVLALGCSKKSDTKNEPPKQEAKPAPEAPKPAETPADKPPPPPPPAAAPPVDCAAVVTADDIQKACKAKVEIEATRYEGQGDLMVCNRTIKDPATHNTVQFGVSRFANPAAIDTWVQLDKTNSKDATFKDVAGIGDGAYTKTAETKSLKTTDYDLGVRKGNLLMHLGYMVNDMNKKPPCTLDQLQEVARAAVARLP